MTEQALKFDPFPIVRLASARHAGFRIGAISVYVRRQPRDWTVAWRLDRDVDLDQFEPATEWPDDLELFETARFGFAESPPELSMRPVLGDRSYVVEPEIPLSIPPGQAIDLYVGTALWMALHPDAGPELLQLPTVRPSDTWFGENTRSGELCYVARTKARTGIEEFEPRANRAITPITIDNLSTKPFTVDHLKIPIMLLELYRDSENRHWTRGLRATVRDDRPTEIELKPVADASDRGWSQVGTPRQAMDRNLILRTFDAFTDLSARLI